MGHSLDFSNLIATKNALAHLLSGHILFSKINRRGQRLFSSDFTLFLVSGFCITTTPCPSPLGI